MTWERAVQVFASSKDWGDLTPRSKITAPLQQSPPWANVSAMTISGPALEPDVPGNPDVTINFSADEPTDSKPITVHFAVSVWYNGEVFGAPASQDGNPGQNGKTPSDYYRFMAYPTTVLGPLSQGGENDRTSLQSFDDAASVWRYAHEWLGDRVDDVKGRVSQLESYGDWSGSAADAYMTLLRGMETELSSVQNFMNPQRVTDALSETSQALSTAVNNLHSSYLDWYHSDAGNAMWVYKQALWKAFFEPPAQVDWIAVPDGYTAVITTKYGDPTDKAFWMQVDDQAKQDWLAGMSVLDTAAAREMETLSGKYVTLIDKLGDVQRLLDPISLPDTDGANGSTDNPINRITDALTKNNQDLQNLFDTSNKSLTDLANGNSKSLQDLSAGIGGGLDSFGNSLKNFGGVSGIDGGPFANGAPGSFLLGPASGPVLGPDGNPAHATDRLAGAARRSGRRRQR
jgi:hypothetical protein